MAELSDFPSVLVMQHGDLQERLIYRVYPSKRVTVQRILQTVAINLINGPNVHICKTPNMGE
jgi:hypothetical protein